jgi:hypothetical protein
MRGVQICGLDNFSAISPATHKVESLCWVCAVQRRRFPVGENPSRQSLQPEAIGAVMEEVAEAFD